MTPTLPQILWVVRHGQSAGNVARDAAEAGGLQVIDIATRDIDVPLSELGRRQLQSQGHWLGSLPLQERPQALLCSPYVRAQEQRSCWTAAACGRPSNCAWTSTCAKRSSASWTG